MWTIGWGSTGAHVKPGMTITRDEAETLLRQDLRRFEECVERECPVATDNQFAAMVSLAYNIGVAAFQNSTLARRFNAGDKQGAADEFLRWKYAGGNVLLGLRRRREAERAMFLGASVNAAIKMGNAVV